MTAKARIEFVQLGRTGADAFRDGSVIQKMIGAGAILSSTAASVQSAAAPEFPAVAHRAVQNFARLTGVSNAVVATFPDDDPTATQTNGLRVGAGQTIYIPVKEGQKVAVIEATDA